MTDDRAATREALRKAAEYVRWFLRGASPSAEDAAAWTISVRANTAYLRNDQPGAIATALDKRRPLFGNRDFWSNTNKYHPERTNWDTRAMAEASDTAAEMFGDEWVREVARQSDGFWEES